MGAGSAKGLRKSVSENDADNVSVNSDGQWNESDGGGAKAGRPDTGTVSDAPKRSKSFDFPRADTGKSTLRVVQDNDDSSAQQPKKEAKKTSFFSSFSRRNKNEDDESDQETDVDDRQTSTTTMGRYNIFGGKKKDEKLDTEIDDIEKTFDSLGIIGKTTMVDGKDIKPTQKSKDDIDALEPMRNKAANVRTSRPIRGLNGVAGGVDIYGKGDPLSSTSSSRRKFQFSWDNEDDDKKSNKQVDEWSYQTVQIEGFDINKFKQANVQNTIDINGSSALPPVLRSTAPDEPHAIESDRGRSPSPLQYDADDQQILASIERALSE